MALLSDDALSVLRSNNMFRTGYDGLNAEFSNLTALECTDASLTHQSFRDECDVNNIVPPSFSGFFDSSMANPNDYFDVTLVSDYHTAINQVMYAQDSFDSLPAELRRRFNNDPGEYVNFFLDPANTDEAISLGLAAPRDSSAPRFQNGAVGAEETPAPVGASSSSSEPSKKGS